MPTGTAHSLCLNEKFTCPAYTHEIPVKYCVWAASHCCDGAPSLLYHQDTRGTIPWLQAILPEAITDA